MQGEFIKYLLCFGKTHFYYRFLTRQAQPKSGMKVSSYS